MRFTAYAFAVVFLFGMVAHAQIPAAAAPVVAPSTVTDARLTTIPNDPFRERLRSGYLQLADYVGGQGLTAQARIYERKALSSVHGIIPSMESLYDKDISLNRLNSLLGAKYFLESAFMNGVRELEPMASADAQLMFDCWVEQEMIYARSHRVVPVSVVHPCQQDYQQAEQAVFAAQNELRHRAYLAEKERLDTERNRLGSYYKSENSRALAVQKAQLKKLPENLLIFFDFNKTDLDLTDKEMLGKVAKDIKLFNPRKVIISGNADKVGSDAYNMRLAQKRGIAVANYLIDEYGVDPDLLDIKAYGENNPRAPQNLSKEERNRYVQIIFEKDNRFYEGQGE